MHRVNLSEIRKTWKWDWITKMWFQSDFEPFFLFRLLKTTRQTDFLKGLFVSNVFTITLQQNVYVFLQVQRRRMKATTCCCSTGMSFGGFHTCGVTCSRTFSTMSACWRSRWDSTCSLHRFVGKMIHLKAKLFNFCATNCPKQNHKHNITKSSTLLPLFGHTGDPTPPLALHLFNVFTLFS